MQQIKLWFIKRLKSSSYPKKSQLISSETANWIMIMA
jgi:hypothetical protein